MREVQKEPRIKGIMAYMAMLDVLSNAISGKPMKKKLNKVKYKNYDFDKTRKNF